VSEQAAAGRIRNAADFEAAKSAALARSESVKRWISVCGGPSCAPSKAGAVRDALEGAIIKHRLKKKVGLRQTGCHGFCEHGPLVVLTPEGICYGKVKPEDVPEIVEQTVMNQKVIERLLYVDPETGERIEQESEIPFYKKQTRTLMASNKFIDYTEIDDYIALGGYEALVKVLTAMSPEDVTAEVKNAGLRGRGGAGFPTGVKWELCRKQPADAKYVEPWDCHRPGKGTRASWYRHTRHGIRFRSGDLPGCRRFRVRRRNGPYRVDRRAARNAATASAVSRAKRTLG
jgi:NADH-quinone oxidoreductase subunit F